MHPNVSAQIAIATVLLGGTIATCACAAGGAHSQSEPAPSGADWSAFRGHDSLDLENQRVVPETPVELTGVPYIHAIRLAWTAANEVPSFEERNQTLQFPREARQAVLLVAVDALPEEAEVRVEWFHNGRRVFVDYLASREDGNHFFALIKEEGRRLEPLPPGAYRADVYDGSRAIKSIRFEVSG